MANYRKKVRDALVSALSNASSGFNPKLSAAASTYGITAFTLDFTLPSNNVVYGYLEDDEVEISKLIEFPGAIIYTSEAVKENKVKFSQFSGFVAAHVAMYIRLRKLDDANITVNQPDFTSDYEKWPDAVEDAMNDALCSQASRAIFSAAGVNQVDYRVDRQSILSVGDGHVQRIDFTLGFEVHL